MVLHAAQWAEGELVIGVDEAGRGCLAGPVFAGAVLWRRPPSIDPKDLALLRDSKTLSRAQRARARDLIESRADAWSVGTASVEEIERHNILGATMIAMHRAIDQVVKEANIDSEDLVLLIDGNRFKPYISPITTMFVPCTCIPEGDSKVVQIAAASILAKTHKDEFMQGPEAHGRYPQYGWDANSGYGTEQHIRSLAEHGPCSLHRKSFAPVRRSTSVAHL